MQYAIPCIRYLRPKTASAPAGVSDGPCATNGAPLHPRNHAGSLVFALKTAAIASGISVSRQGASQSIPYIDEVKEVDARLVTDFSCLL